MINIVKRTSEALCTSLHEIRAITFSQNTIMEALAKAIFEQTMDSGLGSLIMICQHLNLINIIIIVAGYYY